MQDYSRDYAREWEAYVLKTTQKSNNAIRRRNALYDVLRSKTFGTVRAAVEAVGGNARDREWLSVVIQSGLVRRTVQGMLVIAETRAEPTATFDLDEALQLIKDMTKWAATDTTSLPNERWAEFYRAALDFADDVRSMNDVMLQAGNVGAVPNGDDQTS